MRWIAFAVVLGVNIVDALDATIASIAGPSIHVDLGGGTNTVQWPSAGYTLTSQIRQLEIAVGTALLRAGPDGRLTLTAHGHLFARDVRPARNHSHSPERARTTSRNVIPSAARDCSLTRQPAHRELFNYNETPAHGVQVHATASPAITAPRLPGPHRPGKLRGPPGGHTGMHARLGGPSQAWIRPGTGTGTPPSGYPHRSLAPIPVRYVSVDPATRGYAALQGDTLWDRAETARIAENPQLAGRFRRWWQVWQVLGSNQRRLSRRFYSTLAPPEAPPLTSAYAVRGIIPGCRRPLCVRGRRVPGPPNPRTGTDGEGRSGVQTVRRSGMGTAFCVSA